MKKIKIAQIGTGHDHATAAIQTLKILRDEGLIDLIGFCTVPEDRFNLSELGYENNKQAYSGVEKLTLDEILNFDGLDAVVIETEDRALTKYAYLAAQKKLNIQMDKPGGIDDGEFDKLIDLVKSENLVFHTGYMYRYNPEIKELKKKIGNGDLGEIISVEAQMNCSHGEAKREWLKAYPGGMLYFLGCHMVDLVYSIMGEPKEIIPLSCSTNIGNIKAEDFGMAIFKYENGVSFAKSTAVEKGGFERRQLVVVGTKGTVEIRPLEWANTNEAKFFSPQTTGVREIYSGDWHKKGDFHISPVHGRYDAMFRAFIDYVSGKAENPYSYEYERSLHKILLKACGKEII